MIIASGFVGIDVSKHHLDIFDAAVGVAARVANTAAAVAELAHDWARRDAFVLFEATGRYDLDLRHALTAAGVRFARVNPARARDFAHAAGFLAKTDAVDAEMLAAMAQCLQLPPAKAGLAAREQLAALNRRRDQLVANRQQERTRQRECLIPSRVKALQRTSAGSTRRSKPFKRKSPRRSLPSPNSSMTAACCP